MVPQRQHCQARENRWTRWMERMLPTYRSDKSASSSVLINSERAKVDSSDNCLNAAHTTRTWLLAGHEDKAQQFSTCHQKTPHLPPEHPTCHQKTSHLPPEHPTCHQISRTVPRSSNCALITAFRRTSVRGPRSDATCE